jgi:hypothetical protein
MTSGALPSRAWDGVAKRVLGLHVLAVLPLRDSAGLSPASPEPFLASLRPGPSWRNRHSDCMSWLGSALSSRTW